ncbi:MAG TPA: hypothetical protein GX517_05480 [Alicyclobacillus sp.]|nr:hypothetical protein [Alicyclobacillus sp.]
MIDAGGPKSWVEWRWVVRPETPWSIRGPGQEGASLLAPARDWRNRPYIPGSTMRGKIRDSFRKWINLLATAAGTPAGTTDGPARSGWIDVERYCFGEPGTHPGRLYVDDSYAEEQTPGPAVPFAQRPRIAIDRRMGVVKDNFFVAETLVTTEWSFSGGMGLYTSREDVIALLTLAVLGVKSLGSGRSIGRGRLSWGFSGDEDPGSSLLTVLVNGAPWAPAASRAQLQTWVLDRWFRL